MKQIDKEEKRGSETAFLVFQQYIYLKDNFSCQILYL